MCLWTGSVLHGQARRGDVLVAADARVTVQSCKSCPLANYIDTKREVRDTHIQTYRRRERWRETDGRTEIDGNKHRQMESRGEEFPEDARRRGGSKG